MKESHPGPCGLFCGACGQPDCDGCTTDVVPDWVPTCEFRVCARAKGIDFCCFCDEFPCDELHRFMNDPWPHHWTTGPNLAYIKEHGVDKWLAVQKEEWKCRKCGAGTRWYQRKCECGEPLDAWDLPEDEARSVE